MRLTISEDEFSKIYQILKDQNEVELLKRLNEERKKDIKSKSTPKLKKAATKAYLTKELDTFEKVITSIHKIGRFDSVPLKDTQIAKVSGCSINTIRKYRKYLDIFEKVDSCGREFGWHSERFNNIISKEETEVYKKLHHFNEKTKATLHPITTWRAIYGINYRTKGFLD